MIGLKLGTYLGTRPAINNCLSNRIYPNRKVIKEKTYPNSVITVIGGNPEYSLSGPIADLKKTVQVDVDALTEYEAIEVASLIRNEIEFSPGVPGDQTWDDAVIKSCTVQNERDQTFPPVDASDQWIFRRSIDYQVTYVR